jgi:hypothetical protein
MLPKVNFDAVAVTIPLYSAYSWCESDDASHEDDATFFFFERDCAPVREQTETASSSSSRKASVNRESEDLDIVNFSRMVTLSGGNSSSGQHSADSGDEVMGALGSPCSASWTSSAFGGARCGRDMSAKVKVACDRNVCDRVVHREPWVSACVCVCVCVVLTCLGVCMYYAES